MKDIFKDDVSLSRIKAVLTSLAKAGEINLCVLDVLGNPIIYPTNDCALCKCVRESAHGRAQCIKYASHSVLEAMREKRTYFYVCPFGLVDFVTPIFYDGEFLGAVCGGQVRSTEAAARADFVYPFFGRNEYGVDEKRMRELFEAMPDRPAERFFESAKLVELFAGNLGSVTAVVEMSRREEAENLAERERLRPAFSHIEKSFIKDIALGDMAELCHMSENYFSRLFGRVTGTTFPRYINGLRIARAKELLLSGTLKVNTVAYEVGYDDPAYFVRKFKQFTGMSPTEWQRFKRAETVTSRAASGSDGATADETPMTTEG